MPAQEVLTILGALDAAGVRHWVSGGWGIDALAGEQTRIHRDLDLILDAADGERAVQIGAELGYREHYRVRSDVPTFSRTVLTDPAARVVDLHPVESGSLNDAFDHGNIGSTIVPCLSRSFQLAAHAGYRQRRHDRHDTAVLDRLT